MQYLIKNAPDTYIHINLATNHFIEKVDGKIKTNTISVYFYEEDSTDKWRQWAKKNKIWLDVATSKHNRVYKYVVLLPATLYHPSQEVNNLAEIDENRISMTFSSILDPALTTQTESPVEVKNGELYINGKRLFKVMKGKKNKRNNSRENIYQENVIKNLTNNSGSN